MSRALGTHPQGFTFATSYGYVPRVSGVDPGHDSYLKTSVEWNLLKGKSDSQKLSLKAQYEKGGLELTKQQVETFTVGLGITF